MTTAKNYLNAAEIAELNRIVTMWLDFAEDQALRRKEVFLKDWAERLDAFLQFNERRVLDGAGSATHRQAAEHAQAQYERFAAERRAALERDGQAYAARLLQAPTQEPTDIGALDQVAKRLAKGPGPDEGV